MFAVKGGKGQDLGGSTARFGAFQILFTSGGVGGGGRNGGQSTSLVTMPVSRIVPSTQEALLHQDPC